MIKMLLLRWLEQFAILKVCKNYWKKFLILMLFTLLLLNFWEKQSYQEISAQLIKRKAIVIIWKITHAKKQNFTKWSSQIYSTLFVVRTFKKKSTYSGVLSIPFLCVLRTYATIIKTWQCSRIFCRIVYSLVGKQTLTSQVVWMETWHS